jgi:tRNA(Ile)-lysidine synthase
MPVLAGLGLTRERLLLAANAMARVRPVLEDATAALARAAARITPAAECVITRSDYLSAPQEIRLRLMARALTWVGGRDAPPRLDSLIAADADIGRGLAAFTLHGCQVRVRGASLVIRREAARTAPPVPPDAEWDGRWLVRGAGRSGGLVLGALGAAGLSQLPDWRASGHPREALLSTPALWQGTTLISAPLAGRSAGYTACFARDLPWDRNAG